MSTLAHHRQLAPNASVRVSPLCLGAMTFGTAQAEQYGEVSKETAFAILDHFYENGGNFIDTANAYQNGESELWLGEWMQQHQNRDEIVLATKYSAAYTAGARIKSNVGGNGTKSMRLSIAESLKRLQTTYIDLFYLHWWDYTISIPEMMHSLNDLVSAGQVNYLGISDTPAWIVAKANQYARDHGLRQFVVYQGMWSAALRDFERDIILMVQDEGMGMCPYGALNQGRFQTEAMFKERGTNNPGRNFIPLSQRDKDVSKVLEQIANARNADVEIFHIALAYVFHKSPYVFPIVGGRKVEHIMSNMKALRVSLTSDEIDAIDSAYPFDPGFPHTFLSGTMFNNEKPRGTNSPDDVWLTKMMSDKFEWVQQAKPIELTRQQK